MPGAIAQYTARIVADARLRAQRDEQQSAELESGLGLALHATAHRWSLAPSMNSSGAVTLSTCAMGDIARNRARSSASGDALMRRRPSCSATAMGLITAAGTAPRELMDVAALKHCSGPRLLWPSN